MTAHAQTSATDIPRPSVCSDVSEVVPFARSASRRSLSYFLSSVCDVRLDEPTAQRLQKLPLRDLARLGFALLLWTTRVRGLRFTQDVPRHIDWLFPEGKHGV